MIRQTSIKVDDDDREDQSMRWIEYSMAIVAFVVAGILALVR
jgi:hypothetical protein